jgi:hypothetical protein
VMSRRIVDGCVRASWTGRVLPGPLFVLWVVLAAGRFLGSPWWSRVRCLRSSLHGCGYSDIEVGDEH